MWRVWYCYKKEFEDILTIKKQIVFDTTNIKLEKLV
jgi:hypothetical protein